MTIFVVIPQPNANTPKLGTEVVERFPGKHFALDGGNGWLVATSQTVTEVSDTLKITNGTNGAALIFEIGSYFGRANRNIWAWIKSNWEQP